MNFHDIHQQALAEIEAEDREAAVAREKQRLLDRRARPWWHVLIPFTIKIARR